MAGTARFVRWAAQDHSDRLLKPSLVPLAKANAESFASFHLPRIYVIAFEYLR